MLRLVPITALGFGGISVQALSDRLIPSHADNVKISPNGSMVTISEAEPKNQGAYRCIASNRFGIANSVVNLMVQGKWAKGRGSPGWPRLGKP